MSTTWINQLDYTGAIQEIKSDEKLGKDFCLDPLRFEDLGVKNVEALLIQSVKNRITRGICEDLIEIDCPKSNYILRPGARPTLIDWVSYTALSNFIATKTFKEIPDNSYSFQKYKDKFFKRKQKRGVQYWLEFEDKTVEQSKTHDFLLVTDIVSFYENISIEELKTRLRMLSNDKEYTSVTNLLTETFLTKWTNKNRVKGFGLPQGPSASSILADIYLYSVDRKMNESGINYFRFMDDIRILAKTKHDLKKALMTLTRSLRELKLNLNAKKTFIYETRNPHHMKKVVDVKRNDLSTIDKAFDSKEKDQVSLMIPLLMDLLTLSQTTDGPFGERYLKFFISHIIALMRFNVIDESVLEGIYSDLIINFEDKPHLSALICHFFVALSRFDAKYKKKIKTYLLKFLLSKENIYYWQSMWALDTIRQIGDISKEELSKLHKVKASHELCRAQLRLLDGEFGGIDEKEAIFQILKLGRMLNDQYRYLFLAIQSLNKKLLKEVEGQIPEYFREYVYQIKGKKFGFHFVLGEERLTESEKPDYFDLLDLYFEY